MTITKTAWHCNRCGASGTFAVRQEASVYDGIYKPSDEHDTASPDCGSCDLAQMRVWLIEEAS